LGETAAALYALQQLDTRIAELERQLAALDDGSALRAELEQMRAQSESQAVELRGLEKELLDTELKMKSFEEKKAGFERKMYSGQVSNPKELGDMQREVEMLRRSISDLEDKALTFIDQVEERRRTHAGARRALEEGEQRLAQVTERFERENARCRGELDEASSRRAAAAAIVPREALKRYEDLLPRKGNLAIVEASGGICHGCHVSLATDLARDLRRSNELRYCDTCGRILHLPEA